MGGGPPTSRAGWSSHLPSPVPRGEKNTVEKAQTRLWLSLDRPGRQLQDLLVRRGREGEGKGSRGGERKGGGGVGLGEGGGAEGEDIRKKGKGKMSHL